jgi:hypothetical protein
MSTAAKRSEKPSMTILRRPRVRLGAVVALAVAAALIAAAIARDHSNGSTAPSAIASGPVALTAAQLRDESRVLDQPIFWAGPRAGYTYEFTRTANGNIYVRYLPAGVKVGATRPRYLIVGTYPFPHPLKMLRIAAGKRGVSIPGNGLALVHDEYPQSVHMAFPNTNYQVEVFDPSPARALAVARSGDVTPVR